MPLVPLGCGGEKKRRVSQKDTGTSSASDTAAAQNDKVLQPSSFDWEEWEQCIGVVTE